MFPLLNVCSLPQRGPVVYGNIWVFPCCFQTKWSGFVFINFGLPCSLPQWQWQLKLPVLPRDTAGTRGSSLYKVHSSWSLPGICTKIILLFPAVPWGSGRTAHWLVNNQTWSKSLVLGFNMGCSYQCIWKMETTGEMPSPSGTNEKIVPFCLAQAIKTAFNK